MKIFAVSDLHLDINMKRKTPHFKTAFINYLQNLSGDILIIAGDIAGNTNLIVDFFNSTQHLDFSYKLYVPGNHDIWVNQNASGLSGTKYYEILPELAHQFDWYYLPNNPLILEERSNIFGFVGTMGWYDYSSRNKIWDDYLAIDDYRSKFQPKSNLELMDRHYVQFNKQDEEIADQFIDDLKQDISFIERRYDPHEIDELVIVSHMVPFEEFIKYRGMLKYDYFTAFFGNFKLGSLIEALSKKYSIHSIFGQTHLPKIRQLSSTLKGYCVPIGYPREYGKDISIDELFKNRIIEITV